MPRTLAHALTASRSGLGILMLSCAALGSNSNLTALPPDRSYCVRSAVSTKCCASSSVSKLGIFFFIIVYLLLVHVSSADRSDIFLAVAFPDCENDEQGSAVSGPADGPMPFLGWGRIGQEDDGLCKQPLDLRTGDPVFPAMLTIALIPFESGNGRIHNTILHGRIYIPTSIKTVSICEI